MPYKDKNKTKESARRRYNPEKRKDRHLRSDFGINIKTYNSMLEEQKSKCAICGGGEGEVLYVDHDHKTGKVRGLLCHRCNTALGRMKDNPSLLEKAIFYIKRKVG